MTKDEPESLENIKPITPPSGRANDAYNTHHSKNIEKARQKQHITPIIQNIVGCNSHLPVTIGVWYSKNTLSLEIILSPSSVYQGYI